ncbi:MAG: ATP-dependent DNA ligase [Nanoarchaeota archaeon]
MKYSDIVLIYNELSKTTGKLEKSSILAKFLPHFRGHEEYVYLLRGRVFAEYDVREFGVSTQLVIKAIAKSSGLKSEKVVEHFRKEGDLGDVAATLWSHKKQSALFSKTLTAEHVLASLRSLCVIEGHGAVDKKLNIIVELLMNASSDEARYIIRTILGDLRIGVADAILLDAVVEAFFSEDLEMHDKVRHAYDLVTDLSRVLEMAFKGKKAFEHVMLLPGRPMNVMLPVKVTEIDEAFRICGKPAAIEHKYDGFRVLISFDGKEIKLFTRRLEDVTKQFPDVVEHVKSYVKGKSFILDSEVVGYNKEKKKYLPFEGISQRIKRKYHIDKLVRELPVEVVVFDVLYYNGENSVELPFKDRRKLLESIVKEERWKFKLATQIVTDDVKKAEEFYKNALKIGEEGVIFKNLESTYKPGRYVGQIVKLKPQAADLDLVIIGAEYGKGKRTGGLTSFNVACRHNGDFLSVGMVSSGLKEKSEEGTTYKEIDEILQKLVTKEEGNYVHVKPKVIVSVTYQNVQKSPTYSSGHALRFPRITHYRPERGVRDIASLEDIEKEVKRGIRKSER